MSQPAPVTLTCPAKVNLALSVGGPDAEGMHPIASWMVAVEFCDLLTVEHAPGGTAVQLHVQYSSEAPLPGEVDWEMQDDLAYRAAVLFEPRDPVAIRVTKFIPTGAGLGGGSSNAAAALVAMQRLEPDRYSSEQLLAMAGQLGSDVPFLLGAIGGTSSAVVTGLGEQVEPAHTAGPIHLVLIFPGCSCATGPVYRMFDRLRPEAGPPDRVTVRHLAMHWPILGDEAFNDLAEAACQVEPQLAAARDAVRESVDEPVHVTGSGSTLFVIAESTPHAHDLAHRITERTDLPCVPTRTLRSRG